MLLRACVAVLLVLSIVGCGEDSTVNIVNQPPTIEFTFAPIVVTAQTDVELTVSVSDPNEDDALTVTWSITRGGPLVPANAQKTAVTWSVPAELGTDTVTVSVSDGEETASVTEVLRVGTLVATARGTWGLSDSPYILRPGDVPPRLLVTGTNVVEPGVEIFVDLPETIIDVTGSFRVNGTADQPVVITANDRRLFCDDNRGWWEGFLVNGPSGNVNLSHAQVRYAVNGVRMRDSGSAILNSTFIKCCGTNGILNEGVGSVSIDSCEVTDTAGHGINVTNAAGRPSAISITNSDISFNGNTGLVLNFIDPANETPVTIEGNRFQYNDTHGISMEAWVWPQIHYNHFNSNGDLGASNIWLQNPFHDSAGNTIDVTCNFWGQSVSSQAVIDNTIRDSLDNSNLGARLDTQPWLNADPYLAATLPPCDGQEAQLHE